MGPAMEVSRAGGLLAVDEIDASLNPHLLEMFADPGIDTHHAQLAFTSHDSYVLSEVQLATEQVWFTDKTDGVTKLIAHLDAKPGL